MTWPLDPITSDILVLAAVLLAAITLIWKFWDRFAAKRWAQKSEVTAVKRLVKIVEELNLLRSLRDNPTSLLASVAVEFGFGLIGGVGLMLSFFFITFSSHPVIIAIGILYFFAGASLFARFCVRINRFTALIELDSHIAEQLGEIDKLLAKAGRKGDEIREEIEQLMHSELHSG